MDDTFEPTDQPNALQGFDWQWRLYIRVNRSLSPRWGPYRNYHDGNHTHQEGNYSDYGHYDMEFEPIPVAEIGQFRSKYRG